MYKTEEYLAVKYVTAQRVLSKHVCVWCNKYLNMFRIPNTVSGVCAKLCNKYHKTRTCIFHFTPCFFQTNDFLCI